MWVRPCLHATPYKVSDHISGAEPPAKDYAEYGAWKEIDALVLQWIYSTINDIYLNHVLETDTTARKTWLQLENIFLNNKTARTMQGLVTQLVLESRLVTQLVQGLPQEYTVVGALINQLAPSWDDARTMLNHEEMRIKNQTRQGTSSTVLAATTVPPDACGPSSSTQGRGFRQVAVAVDTKFVATRVVVVINEAEGIK
ncbi:uncharacterized protein LOC143549575 [Bidens hawaiensis]|uniref:uncharacterized protein LOC143549575 n=1 Tax=Bidens hawaiensis TaxID=980011 RepID=UPI00404A7D66